AEGPAPEGEGEATGEGSNAHLVLQLGETSLADAGDVAKLVHAAEAAVGLAVLHDAAGEDRSDAGQVLVELLGGRLVEVEAAGGIDGGRRGPRGGRACRHTAGHAAAGHHATGRRATQGRRCAHDDVLTVDETAG